MRTYRIEVIFNTGAPLENVSLMDLANNLEEHFDSDANVQFIDMKEVKRRGSADEDQGDG